MSSFRPKYARYYDILYFDKNYETECNFIERITRRTLHLPVRSILDISCGTGGHSIPLALRGYHVTALDSSRSMIEIAKAKASRMGCEVEFRVEHMNCFKLPKQYDLCISMFDSIDYLRNETEVVRAFETVSSHMAIGGLFMFQFWNKRAVKKLSVQQRHKVVNWKGLTIVRLADSELNVHDDNCTVNYRIIVIRGGIVIDDFNEKHTMRYFDPKRIETLLKRSGFTITRFLKPFTEAKASSDDWSVIALARKGKERGQSVIAISPSQHGANNGMHNSSLTRT